MSTGNIDTATLSTTSGTLRLVAMLYSITCYFIGVATLLYLILFIADLWVPVSLNAGSGFAPKMDGVTVLIWNVVVIAFWGLQHSIMARPAFKRIWTRIVPAAIERSTYLVFVALATLVLVMFWQPMTTVIWDVSGTMLFPVLLGLYFFGWVVVLFSSFLLNHFHLFGLQQALLNLKDIQSKQASFKTPLLYRFVRHPMMTGVLIALWCAPVMTTGRLTFNVLMTVYVFIGVYFEEKTLEAELGAEYRDYQQSTPSVIPRLRK